MCLQLGKVFTRVLRGVVVCGTKFTVRHYNCCFLTLRGYISVCVCVCVCVCVRERNAGGWWGHDDICVEDM